MEYNGVDVSEVQGTINWQSVASNGIKFAIIRATYGSSGVDSQFVSNISKIPQTDISPGAYHQSSAQSINEAVAEANHFLNTVRPYNFYYPLALNIESEVAMRIGKSFFTNIISAFLNVIKEAKYYPMLYAGIHMINNYIDISRIPKTDIWLSDLTAKSGTRPSFDKNVTIWQHSQRGNVQGILGNANLNISYVDYPAVVRQKGLNHLQPIMNNNSIISSTNNNSINSVNNRSNMNNNGSNSSNVNNVSDNSRNLNDIKNSISGINNSGKNNIGCAQHRHGSTGNVSDINNTNNRSMNSGNINGINMSNVTTDNRSMNRGNINSINMSNVTTDNRNMSSGNINGINMSNVTTDNRGMSSNNTTANRNVSGDSIGNISMNRNNINDRSINNNVNNRNTTNNMRSNNLEPDFSEPSFYTVEKGDTLRSIAKKIFGDPEQYRRLMELNSLNRPIIFAGQTLRMPQNINSDIILHRVKQGDTLWKLAEKFLGHGPRYNEIMSLNGLTTDMIYPGQVLKIPADNETFMQTYTVKEGDTLWKIAQNFLGNGNRYTEIMSLNNLQSGNLRIGQPLKIPLK